MISRRTFGILAVVLVGLGLLSVVTKEKRYGTKPGGGFENLVEADLDPASIARIRAWLGSAPDSTVELEREGEGWVVPTRYGWRAKDSLVDRLLTDLAGLKGESRPASEDILPDFQIDDEKGLHLVAEGSGGTELFHLVVGKAGTRGGTFVRHEGSNDVYLTQASLRSSFGVWGEEPSAPDAKRWIEMRVHKADAKDVDRVVIKDGSGELVLEKEFTPVEAKPDSAAGEAAGETETEAEAGPTIDRAQYVWKFDGGSAVDKSKADGIVSTLCSLYAVGVANPDSVAEYGLVGDDARVAELIYAGGETSSIYFGKQAADTMRVYLRVGDDGKPAEIYKSTVDRIFQDRSELSPAEG